MSKEYCCQCDEPTGRAGRSEDSIWVELPSGADLGPLCERCAEEIMLLK